ncbi:MAG: glycosyltransferase family 4 protein [Lachnospiraceae bacterium]|nr:glycosyltransferase family 4 protein [Lachnospiraceae bacterium]
MKVLFIENNATSLYKSRKELIEVLAKDNDVYFCVPAGKYVEKVEELGAEFINCEFLDRDGMNPLKELKLINYYKGLISEVKPDIVFTCRIKPNVYGGMACRKLNVPYVATVAGLCSAVNNRGILQKITLLLYKIGLKKAKKVFFQNAEIRDFMVNKGVVKGEYDILPGFGINLEQYKVFGYQSADTVDFVYASSVKKEKGIEQFLEAAKVIKKKYPYTRFHICGYCGKAYRKRLKELETEEVILYHGLVDDMTPIYQMASCIVHPSYYLGGGSSVLLESAASGRPIIATDRSGSREIVEDGVNGFIIKEQDSEALIEGIEKFLELNVSCITSIELF